jgi:hypothetical protein
MDTETLFYTQTPLRPQTRLFNSETNSSVTNSVSASTIRQMNNNERPKTWKGRVRTRSFGKNLKKNKEKQH